MSKKRNHRQPSLGNSGRGATVKFTCLGGCGILVPRPFGTVAWCGTCFYVSKTLRECGASTLAELAKRAGGNETPGLPRDYVLARVTDLLRRSGVEDAERLIRAVERL